MKLDSHRINDQQYRTIIDKQEKTITDLKSKLKFNDTRTSLGGPSGFLMKSNLMKADSMLNFRLNETSDFTELKKVLLYLISETQ